MPCFELALDLLGFPVELVAVQGASSGLFASDKLDRLQEAVQRVDRGAGVGLPPMPQLIEGPAVVRAAGTKPKRIEEYAGRVNSGHAGVSVARMVSPGGWQEPGQRPEFEDYGIFEDNDFSKRLMVIANHNHDVAEYWEFSDRGLWPIDLSNEACKLGVNYMVYGLIH